MEMEKERKVKEMAMAMARERKEWPIGWWEKKELVSQLYLFADALPRKG